MARIFNASREGAHAQAGRLLREMADAETLASRAASPPKNETFCGAGACVATQAHVRRISLTPGRAHRAARARISRDAASATPPRLQNPPSRINLTLSPTERPCPLWLFPDGAARQKRRGWHVGAGWSHPSRSVGFSRRRLRFWIRPCGLGAQPAAASAWDAPRAHETDKQGEAIGSVEPAIVETKKQELEIAMGSATGFNLDLRRSRAGLAGN